MRLLTSSILILKLLHDNLSKSSSESRSILSSSVSGFCFSSSPFELDVDFMLLIPDELWSDGVKSPEFRSSVFIFIFSLFFRSDFFGWANIEFIYTCLLLWMNISLSYRFSSPLVFFFRNLFLLLFDTSLPKFRLFNRPCLPSPRNLSILSEFSVSPAWAMKIKLWWLISTCISLSAQLVHTWILNLKLKLQKGRIVCQTYNKKMLRLLDWIMSSDTVGASVWRKFGDF